MWWTTNCMCDWFLMMMKSMVHRKRHEKKPITTVCDWTFRWSWMKKWNRWEDETEIRKLDSTLRSRRIKSRNAEHYYIAFKLPEDNSVFAENVYRQLLSCLPQMTVVQFGVKGSGSLFLIPEEYVSTEVNEFYRAINS